jgi:serine protease AprX
MLLPCVLYTAPASAQSTKIAPDLQSVITARLVPSVPVIIQLNALPSALDTALIQLLGGRVKQVFGIIPAISADLPLGSVLQIVTNLRIKRISLDRIVTGCWDYNVAAVGADAAGIDYRVTGAGIGVAVIDSGIRLSGDFGARIIGFHDCVNGRTVPYDDNGHGTHVAGIVGGAGTSSRREDGCTMTFRGAAPGANLVAVKVLDAKGSSTAGCVIGGIEWCIANRERFKLRVLNLSLGHPIAESYQKDPLNLAVQAAVRAGLTVVCSAGNKGKDSRGNICYGGITCPGNDPCVLTVGATNTFGTPRRSDDGVATYSSRGPTYLDQLAKPDLIAPGNKVTSVRAPLSFLDITQPTNQVLPLNYEGTTLTPTYFTLSGTSMAAPLVAGSVALLLEKKPTLTPNAVKAILMASATPLNLGLSGGLSWMTQGAGCLNVPGALEIAAKVDTLQPVGCPWLTAPLTGQSTIQGETKPWGGTLLWGTVRVTGDLLGRNQAAWGVNVCWGDAVTWGQNVCWGDNAVMADRTWQNNVCWGDNICWGDNVCWGDAQFQFDLLILALGE